MKKIGIIGGSGIYDLDGVKLLQEHQIETPFGNPSDDILELEFNNISFYFIARHHRNHNVLPSEVNYRANIFALKSLGVEYLISISAVGSLKEDLPPSTLVLVDQFIDWTKGGRIRSFFGNGIVAHVSTAQAINLELSKMIEESCKKADLKISVGGTYICIEGPQFSSIAESNLYRNLGASVIGMTNVPEAYLAKEADMAFATVAMVTDFDCWKDEHCNVDDIMKTMKLNNKSVQKLLKILIPILNENKFNFKKEVKSSIMTNLDSLNKEQIKIVEVLAR